MPSEKMNSLTLPMTAARTLAVVKQGLHQRPSAPERAVLRETIRRIGMLQLDSISVVARSHYLVMLSRVGLYDPAELDALLGEERSLFEYWAHAMCLVPLEHYPYFAPTIQERRNRDLHPWHKKQLGDHPQSTLDKILSAITEQGPLNSKDFEDERTERTGWWDYKQAKHALSILFDRGHLMVDRRVHFHIHYDLTERILPASLQEVTKTVADWELWATQQSVGYLGVATAHQASDYYRLKKATTRACLEKLQQTGHVVPVNVEGWKETAYLLAEDVSLVEEILQGKHTPKVTTFLSPFDNLSWHRQRTRELFDFHYTLALYIKVAKRNNGYYVLPILHNGRFVGRLDPKVDRKTKTLFLHFITLEPHETLTEELLAGLTSAIQEFKMFHQCESLHIGRTEPEPLKQALLARLC